MPQLTYEKMNISYHLHKKPAIHFIKIYLDDLNGVQVTASEEKDDDRVEAFLRKKALWIKQKWQDIHASLYYIDHLNLAVDQKISYLGRSYRLLVEESPDAHEPSFAFQRGKFYYTYSTALTNEEAQRLLRKNAKEWLRQKAEEKIPRLSDRMVATEEDHTRLGKKDTPTIYVNWRLVQQPKDVTKQTIDDLWEGKTC